MTDSLARKKQVILDHERALAGKLALGVLDKPKPPLWMIFVPIFFVFFAQKMRQYSSGMEDFVENYLKPRRLALDAALEAIGTGTPADPARQPERAGAIPEHSRALFTEWMNVLADHYQTLLEARGDTPEALIRSGYRTKTDFLLQCNVLGKAEHAFSQSLMSNIEGDRQDIQNVVEKMRAHTAELRRNEADTAFP